MESEGPLDCFILVRMIISYLDVLSNTASLFNLLLGPTLPDVWLSSSGCRALIVLTDACFY